MKTSFVTLLERHPTIATRIQIRAAGGSTAIVVAGLCLLTGVASGQVLPGEQSLQMQYSPVSQPIGNSVADLASGDIDQDGDIDVLAADPVAATIHVRLNNGGLGFSQQTIHPGVAASEIALGDVDSDGDLDLVVGFESGMRWLRNDAGGHFAVAADFPFPGGDSGPVAVELVDVNADGQMDVVIALNSHPGAAGLTGGLWVALGNGAGNFYPLATHGLPQRATNVTLADFNGDSHLDVAELGGYPSASTVSFAYGLGNGFFVNHPANFSAGIYASGIASGDFDGDGDIDLATGFKYWVSIRLNNGAGDFTLAQSVGVGSYVKSITLGDIDRDGDLDLVAASGSASAIRLMTNDASGHFAYFGQVPASIQCYSILLADTSGDGYLDPWAGDVTTGQLHSGTSECTVARYGKAKLNSLGALPAMTAVGTPSIQGQGFTPVAMNLIPMQPALIVVGLGPLAMRALGGQLLVSPPSIFLSATTSAGSGDPALSDATVTLPIAGAQLGTADLGTKLFVQILSIDAHQTDGTSASLTDGLWFEIIP